MTDMTEISFKLLISRVIFMEIRETKREKTCKQRINHNKKEVQNALKNRELTQPHSYHGKFKLKM